MQKSSRITLAVSSLALLIMYLVPMWKISLEAPQYPEGLGMYIWINTVTGEKAHNLENINNLNHYIGMKRIEPDTIPELKIMPWVIAFLIGIGLLSAWSGKRWMLYTWTLLFIAVAVAGLWDFYLWEYDYGHNLDQEHAIIKIPGMNYQPPVIGSKKLLNFTAHSWPWIGGWVAILSVLAGLFLSVKEWRSAKKSVLPVTLLVWIVLLLAGCNTGPKDIRYGEDTCAHCMMQITDDRYGAELVTSTGKAFVFDSIECMIEFSRDGLPEATEIQSYWATDFMIPGTLVNISDVFILESPNLPSPMGANLTAFGSGITQDAALNAFAGNVVSWDVLLDARSIESMNHNSGSQHAD